MTATAFRPMLIKTRPPTRLDPRPLTRYLAISACLSHHLPLTLPYNLSLLSRRYNGKIALHGFSSHSLYLRVRCFTCRVFNINPWTQWSLCIHTTPSMFLIGYAARGRRSGVTFRTTFAIKPPRYYAIV